MEGNAHCRSSVPAGDAPTHNGFYFDYRVAKNLGQKSCVHEGIGGLNMIAISAKGALRAGAVPIAWVTGEARLVQRRRGASSSGVSATFLAKEEIATNPQPGQHNDECQDHPDQSA